jgi:hypothetical protein
LRRRNAWRIIHVQIFVLNLKLTHTHTLSLSLSHTHSTSAFVKNDSGAGVCIGGCDHTIVAMHDVVVIVHFLTILVLLHMYVCVQGMMARERARGWVRRGVGERGRVWQGRACMIYTYIQTHVWICIYIYINKLHTRTYTCTHTPQRHQITCTCLQYVYMFQNAGVRKKILFHAFLKSHTWYCCCC